MDPIRIFDISEKVKILWGKKTGIFFCLLSIIMFYFLTVEFFDKSFTITKSYNFILPIILLVIFLFWLVNTQQVLFKDPNIVGICVCISCDENFEEKAKSLFGTVIDEIRRDKVFDILYVRLLPINKFKSQTEMETWVSGQNGDRNTIIFLNLKNGNVNSEEKITIDAISYSGFFKNNNLSIQGQNLNIINDLSLRVQNQDWSYFEKNSLSDKDKLRNNLKEIILYYGGLFYLNESQFEYSRILLKYLHNPNLSVINGKIDVNDNKKITFEVKPGNIPAGRLNYLLTNIYLQCVINKFNSDKTPEAITLLHEVESFPNPPEIRSTIFTNLAYMYYITNDIARSKHYTALIRNVNPKSFAHLINLGFYAIIENNPIVFAQHYSVIDENCNLDSQPVEVIGFLNDRLNQYQDSVILIESAVAMLTKNFVDEQDGNNKLKLIEGKIPNTNNYKALKRLIAKSLKKKLPKKVQRQLHKTKQAA